MKQLLVFGLASAIFQVIHSAPQACYLNEDSGTGTFFNVYLRYDAENDMCVPFIYKGLEGNANRFTNEIECMRNCSDKAEEKYPMDVTKACHFPKAKGNCQGSFLRWYYDSHHDKCITFIWTGCVGNGNRFIDDEICNATCAGIHDDGEMEEDKEVDTPVAIIVGVVFGILLAIIIIVAIVLGVKSRKEPKKEQRKAKDTETALQAPVIEMS